MFSRLEQIEQQYQDLERRISDPEIHRDPGRYKTLMQEHAHLSELISCYRRYVEVQQELRDAGSMLDAESDPELRELAHEEIERLGEHEQELERELKLLLVPRDPLDEKSSILEIRAGTGGDEASLFAADLYRMYQRYAEREGWKTELMTASETEVGGFKEVVFSINGSQVYGNLKYESGVHRVQRVPATESSGRIHTSAVTVAVLPEAEDTDIRINPEELRIDVFRSSGPGGQSVNTTDSAVRVTHIPTGMVVTCQDEKSQHKNKAKALRVLKARLYEAEEARKNAERANARKNQIGSGDRSERIRTYNFPQNRVTDHRINLTLYKLDLFMQGELDEIVESLKLSDHEEKLKTQNG
ncbi:MAG: peptide chain release factor 1 [Spirochaetaceae bacterium]|nr:MAG: peptide chain release factor 1 [Spirochaetaceae bacterium]